nr:immunoglobulin heavy chain junction region [Mus musculus]
CARQRSFDYW